MGSALTVECGRLTQASIKLNLMHFIEIIESKIKHLCAFTFRKHDICSRCQPPLAKVLMVIFRDARVHSTGRRKCKTGVPPGARSRARTARQ